MGILKIITGLFSAGIKRAMYRADIEIDQKLLFNDIYPKIALSHYEMGMEYYEKKEYERAYACFQKAVDYGSVPSQYYLGIMNLLGLGTTKNNDFSLKYLLKAAENGDVNASYELGNYYKASGDKEKSLEWYKKAAEKGHADALRELARDNLDVTTNEGDVN